MIEGMSKWMKLRFTEGNCQQGYQDICKFGPFASETGVSPAPVCLLLFHYLRYKTKGDWILKNKVEGKSRRLSNPYHFSKEKIFQTVLIRFK